MAEVRRDGYEQVNAFEVDETYLFKHYFEGESIFNRLKYYYNNQQYRFEVPPDEFTEIRSFLAEHRYEVVTVDDIEEYVVVVRKYTAHPDNIFKRSVIHRSVDSYNCFLMTDQGAVEEVTRHDASRITDLDLNHPF